jgi:antibiotic biosynthesis monooxygenase (ABM) superfamily enzyme
MPGWGKSFDGLDEFAGWMLSEYRWMRATQGLVEERKGIGPDKG